MLIGVDYLKFIGNEHLIVEFFEQLFFFRKEKAIEALRNFCNMKGYAINDFVSCHFASEFPCEDEEYFGKTGVVFYLDRPAYLEDYIVVLEYDEFFEVTKNGFETWVKNYPCHNKEVESMLEKLNSILE